MKVRKTDRKYKGPKRISLIKVWREAERIFQLKIEEVYVIVSATSFFFRISSNIKKKKQTQKSYLVQRRPNFLQFC